MQGREILFRAWCENTKTMHYPENDDYFRIFNDGSGSLIRDYGDEECQLVSFDKGCNLMQFTGLYDKNNQPIYEGDVVHLNYEGIRVNGIVKQQDSGTWVLENKEQGTLLGIHHNKERIEMLGNIHANPELIHTPPLTKK